MSETVRLAATVSTNLSFDPFLCVLRSFVVWFHSMAHSIDHGTPSKMSVDRALLSLDGQPSRNPHTKCSILSLEEALTDQGLDGSKLVTRRTDHDLDHPDRNLPLCCYCAGSA